MKITEITNYPVKVLLNKKNPWGKTIKVNNITISTIEQFLVTNEQELKKLLPIEKYLLFEVVGSIAPLPKKSRKSKSKVVETIVTVEPND